MFVFTLFRAIEELLDDGKRLNLGSGSTPARQLPNSWWILPCATLIRRH
jgi:hypothetical protein